MFCEQLELEPYNSAVVMRCSHGGLCNSRGSLDNCKYRELRSDLRRLIVKQFQGATAEWLDKVTENLLHDLESADVRRTKLEENMIPTRPDVEISWITGRNFTRENDIKRMGVNLNGEEDTDGNGRGDGTDGDDGRGGSSGNSI